MVSTPFRRSYKGHFPLVNLLYFASRRCSEVSCQSALGWPNKPSNKRSDNLLDAYTCATPGLRLVYMMI